MCRRITNDNAIGRVAFFATRQLQRMKFCRPPCWDGQE